MTEQLMHTHGGDLDAIEKKYGIPKEEISDFSGNINPLGFPPAVLREMAEHLDIVTTYPDKRYTALRQAIAAYTGADKEHIVVGNGSTELISTFIQTAYAKNSLILGPAYSEYEREISLSGSAFSYFPLKEEDDFQLDTEALLAALSDNIDLFVACNPNNPTGTAIGKEDLERIFRHCQRHHIAVMIDETYIEFAKDPQEICAIPFTKQFDNLFVIRGTSKFFAAPGLRLGYGISSSQAFHTALAKKQDPWNVNSLAAFAGERLFSQTEFHHQSRQLILSEREKALQELSTWKNLKAYPSSSNFILLHLLTDKITAAEIFEVLIRKKLLIRDAASFTFLDESYLRFCIRTPQENETLLKELKELVEK